MTTRTYGSKYDAQMDVADIARLVRKDIKAAVSAGELPAGKYSVKIDRYSMGQSIDVRVSDVAGMQVFSDTYLTGGCDALLHAPCEVDAAGNVTRPGRFSPAFAAVLARLEGILAAYNHDGSDSMSDHFDVKFYGDADADSQWASEKLAAEKAALIATAQRVDHATRASVALRLVEPVAVPDQVRFLEEMGAA